jgi:hypothetical protein
LYLVVIDLCCFGVLPVVGVMPIFWRDAGCCYFAGRRRLLDLWARIWRLLADLLLGVVLRWTEPKTTGRRPAGVSTNKRPPLVDQVVMGCLEHTQGHRGGGEEDIEKQLLPRSEGFQVVFILPGLVHLSFELASKPGVEVAIGGAHQQWIFVGSDAALGGG